MSRATAATRRSWMPRSVTILALLMVISALGALGRDHAGAPAAGDDAPLPAGRRRVVWVSPGQDLQAIVDGQPPSTEFRLRTGLYRLQRVVPTRGSTFVGEPGTVLSGARPLTGFQAVDGRWMAPGPVFQPELRGECDPDLRATDGTPYTGCQYAQDVFVDDVALRRVVSLAEVRPGAWYFDAPSHRVYLGEDPSGRRVEISVTRNAFAADVGLANDHVTLRGLVIEKYANPAQTGAIEAGGDDRGSLSTGWLIEDCEVRLSHGVGIRTGHATQIRDSHIHHNGQLGIGGLGDGIRIEDNVIAHNNTLGFNPEWEAGGVKLVQAIDPIVRGNQVLGNLGPGLWTDIDSRDVLYEDNRVADNAGTGIFHEISYDAIIRRNTVERNGFDSVGWLYGAGILVAGSSNVEVYRNTVRDNAHGIAGIEQARGSGVFGPHLLYNCWVYDNEIEMAGGFSGFAEDTGDDAIFWRRNNWFDRNTYHLGANEAYFEFAGAERTPEQWVEHYGQDVNGRVLR